MNEDTRESPVETGLFYCNSRYYNPEWCRWISPDDIEYLDPESVNGLNLYCYCLNNPIMYVDPSGHFVITAGSVLVAALVGGLLTAGIAYGSDVISNFSDGFEWSDFNTFEDNWVKYVCAFAGGAISGALGALGSTSLQLLGTFVGEMVENAYTFTSWENVGKAISMSLMSTALDGILTIGKYSATRSYIQSGKAGLSKKASKQVDHFIETASSFKRTKIKSPTNIHAKNLINNAEKFYTGMNTLTKLTHILFTL